MQNFESWEDIHDFHERRDYEGLVANCEEDVRRCPNDLYAAERLADAYVLNGNYEKAIAFGAKLHCAHPSMSMFTCHILDALFAIGKTEDDFDWAIRPEVLRLDQCVVDGCYQFLRSKRKPRGIADFHLELWGEN